MSVWRVCKQREAQGPYKDALCWPSELRSGSGGKKEKEGLHPSNSKQRSLASNGTGEHVEQLPEKSTKPSLSPVCPCTHTHTPQGAWPAPPMPALSQASQRPYNPIRTAWPINLWPMAGDTLTPKACWPQHGLHRHLSA